MIRTLRSQFAESTVAPVRTKCGNADARATLYSGLASQALVGRGAVLTPLRGWAECPFHSVAERMGRAVTEVTARHCELGRKTP